MKKYKKILIIVIIGVVLAIIGGLLLYRYDKKDNSLTISEKKWVDENASYLVSIAVPNDLPVFGLSGEGVFFDYTRYLQENIGLNINNDTISHRTFPDGYGFFLSNNYDKNATLFYEDHFVLVSKNTGLLTDIKRIPNFNVAVLNNDLEHITKYYETVAESFSAYDNVGDITRDLNDGVIQYALVPLNEYKQELITNGINILTHISDLNKYYYFKLSENQELNEILKKTIKNWKEKRFEESYNRNNYKEFIKDLKITEADEMTLTNKVYKYGFIENRPYEILASGEYGGITAAYLDDFSKFSNVEFTFKKYKTQEELATNAIKGKINLYYNYYNIITNYIDSGALKPVNYYVVANNSIDLNLSNISGLANKEVYVLKNSYLYDMIQDIDGINIVIYERTSELKNIVKKNSIILIDEYTYDYYLNHITNSYSVRYKGNIDNTYYAFRYQNESDTFYKLFNAYTKTIDPQSLLRKGITTYNRVDKKGRIVSTIAICILSSVVIVAISMYFYKKKSRKIKINTKVKKEDRLKYIDLLTSLKNRNYYNEKVNLWNKNNIYPQACIVLDINDVKALNDSYGHEAGDKQIQAVANILIRTQIDNTELIRTDGNEFLVYVVGYSEKQVLTYMKKLVREFKKLPYENTVAMGFSMIEDDTKLVEDAFNEASIQMRKNKDSNEKD